MRTVMLLGLVLAGCSASTKPLDVPTAVAACADGQTATPGYFDPPTSLVADWDYRSRGPWIAVLAQRSGAREDILPAVGDYGFEEYLAYCQEGAEHVVVDGLGWIDEGPINVRAYIGQTYWSEPDGTPLPDVNDFHAEHWFDEPSQSLAPDNDVYLLILHVPEGYTQEGPYFLQSRPRRRWRGVRCEHGERGRCSRGALPGAVSRLRPCVLPSRLHTS